MGSFDIRSCRLIGIFILIVLILIVFLGLISNAYKKVDNKNNAVIEQTVEEENFDEATEPTEATEEVVDEDAEVVDSQEDETVEENDELTSDEPFEVIDESELE